MVADYGGVINISSNDKDTRELIEHDEDWVHGQAEEIHGSRSPHVYAGMDISCWQKPSLDFASNTSAKQQVTCKLEDPRGALSNAEDVKYPMRINTLESFREVSKERRSRRGAFKGSLDF